MAGGWIFTLGKKNSVGGFAWRRRFMIRAYQRKEIKQLHTGREINRCKERSALLEVTYRRHRALFDASVVMWLPVIWMILIFLKVKARHPAVSHWITFVLFCFFFGYLILLIQTLDEQNLPEFKAVVLLIYPRKS